MESVVLEDHYDENYEPTAEELAEYAKCIGMDPETDADLMWIAREGLKAPLPAEWKPCQTEDGQIYYFNFESGDSNWDHPLDDHYRKLYAAEKEKRAGNSVERAGKDANAVDATDKKQHLFAQDSIVVAKDRQRKHRESHNDSASDAGDTIDDLLAVKNSPTKIQVEHQLSEVTDLTESIDEEIVEVVEPEKEKEKPQQLLEHTAVPAPSSATMNKLLQEKIAALKQAKSASNENVSAQAPLAESNGTGDVTQNFDDLARTVEQRRLEQQQKLDAEYEQFAKQLQQQYTERRMSTESATKRYYERQISELQDTLGRQREEERERLRVAHERELARAREELEAESKTKLQQLRQASFSEAERRVHEDAEQEVTKLSSELNTKRSMLIKQLSELEDNEKSEFDRQMEKKRASWTAAQRKEEQEAERKMQRLKEELLTKQQSFTRQISEVESGQVHEYERVLAEKRATWNARLQEEENKFLQQLADTRRTWTEQLERAELEGKNKLRDIRQQYEREAEQLRVELEEARDKREHALDSARRVSQDGGQSLEAQGKPREELDTVGREQDRMEQMFQAKRASLSNAAPMTSVTREDTSFFDKSIRLEDLDVTKPTEMNARHEENQLLSKELADRLREEENQLARTKMELESQRRQLVNSMHSASDTPRHTAFDEPLTTMDDLKMEPEQKESAPGPEAATLAKGSSFLGQELEQDLHGVLAQLRVSQGRYGLHNASPLRHSVANRSSQYAPTKRTSFLSSSLGSAGAARSSVYTYNSAGTAAVDYSAPRMTGAWRAMESHQRQQDVLREHSNWLRDFRSRIGLERRASGLKSSLLK